VAVSNQCAAASRVTAELLDDKRHPPPSRVHVHATHTDRHRPENRPTPLQRVARRHKTAPPWCRADQPISSGAAGLPNTARDWCNKWTESVGWPLEGGVRAKVDSFVAPPGPVHRCGVVWSKDSVGLTCAPPAGESTSLVAAGVTSSYTSPPTKSPALLPPQACVHTFLVPHFPPFR